MISDLTQREDELGGNTLLIVALLPQADFVALTCPLTAETRPRSTKKKQLFQALTEERCELTKDQPKIAGACVAVCGRLVSFALLALNRPGSRAQRRL